MDACYARAEKIRPFPEVFYLDLEEATAVIVTMGKLPWPGGNLLIVYGWRARGGLVA